MLDIVKSPQNCATRQVQQTAVRALVDKRLAHNRYLAHYLQGWAEANPDKIVEATGAGYSFRDPLVGCFSRRSLPQYFERLKVRFARTGAINKQDLLFYLRGPTNRPSLHDELEFWRESPLIGLTGTAQIRVSRRGIVAESVAYDLNLASDVLSKAV